MNKVRINGDPIELYTETYEGELNSDPFKDFKPFEFETPIYYISLPDSSAGPSLKTQVEMPSQYSGYFPSATRGYFVLLQFKEPGNYFIECRANGAATARGPYNVSLLYHIKVNSTGRQRKGARNPPDRPRKKMLTMVREKLRNNELTQDQYDEIMRYLKIPGNTGAETDQSIDSMDEISPKI
jgi:hypothetical protein